MDRTRLVEAVFSHTVAAFQGGDSLLDYLSRRFPYHGRAAWLERIADGSVRVDGRNALSALALRSGMRVEYRVPEYAEPEVPTDFRVLDEKGDLVLLHKPPGLPVHKTHRVFVNTLANLFRQQKQDPSWTPLHRLDKETSGLLAFARGPQAFRRFSPGASTRWVKLYLAVLRGSPPEQGVHTSPLAENPGDPIRSRMHPDPSGKPAETRFHVLARRSGLALVLARPITGRKHQIRAHCAAAGFPVLGDKIYSEEGRHYLKRLQAPLTDEDFRALGAPHHLLHACYLEIRDPQGEGIQGLDADLPRAFRGFFPEAESLLPAISQGQAFQALTDDQR
jgi:23S rRNA pseudouridine1911/1915/1917 synthase